MDIRFRFGSDDVELSAVSEKSSWRMRLPDGSEKLIEATRLEEDVLRLEVGDRVIDVPFALAGGNVLISFGGAAYEFSPAGAAGAKAGQSEQASGLLTAPMVGTISELFVKEGDWVEAYQSLAVIEAMKVLVTLEAPFAGAVRHLKVNKGDRIEHGATIMEIVAENSELPNSPVPIRDSSVQQ
jgi:biotin carboxyl carrier protein